MVAQSGAISVIMRTAFLAKGLGITFYISTGNEADLDAEDFLGALIDDLRRKWRRCSSSRSASPQLFLEAGASAPAQRQAGRRAARRAAASARSVSASSHTGALAGDHATMTALLRHAAVMVVETMEELVDSPSCWRA